MRPSPGVLRAFSAALECIDSQHQTAMRAKIAAPRRPYGASSGSSPAGDPSPTMRLPSAPFRASVNTSACPALGSHHGRPDAAPLSHAASPRSRAAARPCRSVSQAVARPQRALLQLIQQRRRAAARQVVRRVPMAGGAAAAAAAERGGCKRPRARCQPRQARARAPVLRMHRCPVASRFRASGALRQAAAT